MAEEEREIWTKFCFPSLHVMLGVVNKLCDELEKNGVIFQPGQKHCICVVNSIFLKPSRYLMMKWTKSRAQTEMGVEMVREMAKEMVGGE